MVYYLNGIHLGGIKQAKRQVRRTPLGMKHKGHSVGKSVQTSSVDIHRYSFNPSNEYLLPEAAEGDLPLPIEKEKDIAVIDEISRNDTNAANNQFAEGHIISPAHLNGSVKMPGPDDVEIQDPGKMENATSQNEEEHLPNLWRWPAKRSKFTQVKNVICSMHPFNSVSPKKKNLNVSYFPFLCGISKKEIFIW